MRSCDSPSAGARPFGLQHVGGRKGPHDTRASLAADTAAGRMPHSVSVAASYQTLSHMRQSLRQSLASAAAVHRRQRKSCADSIQWSERVPSRAFGSESPAILAAVENGSLPPGMAILNAEAAAKPARQSARQDARLHGRRDARATTL